MDKNVQVTNLPVMILQEGSYFVAYTPALDLSVQGKTKAEVQKRFGEAVQLFFEELYRLDTVDETLEELGWQKVAAPRSDSNSWTPPKIVSGTPTEIGVAIPALA
jgi:predicted RNase H-like HicB family nuclease